MSETTPATTDEAEARSPYGLLVEFETPDALLKAAERVRDAGYRKWDAHTPFPVHGLDRAMGVRPTILPWLVVGGGVTGAIVGLGLQWWTNAVNYPFLVSGKPFFSLPANIPIVFELTVLLAAIACFVWMLALNGLPQLYHAVFKSRRFLRATNDRFFITIEARDPIFDCQKTREFAESLDGVAVEDLED